MIPWQGVSLVLMKISLATACWSCILFYDWGVLTLCTGCSLATTPTCTSSHSPMALRMGRAEWQFLLSNWEPCWSPYQETTAILLLCGGPGQTPPVLAQQKPFAKQKPLHISFDQFWHWCLSSCLSALLSSSAAALFLWEVEAVWFCPTLLPNVGSGCMASDGAGLPGNLWPSFRKAVKHISS